VGKNSQMKLTEKLHYLYPEQTPHQQKEGRLAVIDIGSSMVRLVIYDNGAYPHLFLNHKVWCLLGKHKGKGQFVLAEDRMDRAASAIEWFLWVCKQSGVSTVLAVASSAVRDADNGVEFVERIRQDYGLRIEIIEGSAEAELAAKGALTSVPDSNGLVVDLGGGSLDICLSNLSKHASLPLGVLTLQALSKKNPRKAEAVMREGLQRVKWLKNGVGQDLVAIGSGMRSIAKLHMAENAYPMRILHDYRIDRLEAIDFCEQFMKGKVSRRLPGMTRAWREILPYRAAALSALLKETDAERVRFASFGLREGVLFSQLENDVMGGDPLLSFAKDMAERDGRGSGYGAHLAKWASGILPDVELRLLQVATLFSEVGWREQAAYRAQGAFEMIYGGSFVAVGHRNRARLALMVYFRHENKMMPGMAARVKGVVTKEEIEQAKVVGALLHLASLLDPGAQGLLDNFSLEKTEDGTLELHGPKPFMAMESETVAKCLKFLNKHLLNL